MPRAGAAALVAFVLASAGAPALAQPASGSAGDGSLLQPGERGAEGGPASLHVTESDMPWRIAIGLPRTSPRYGSRQDARLAAIEAMQMWERAIQPQLPWFRLEFVEKDASAPVQVRWKRRITGPFGGFGGQKIENVGGRWRLAGEIQVSTTPSTFVTLSVDQVRRLVAHEFGHVLGLGHCLDCDSAMNYAWHTRERVLVTDLDVRSFLALVAQADAPGP